MQESSEWQGLPYYPISQFYKKHFGSKVYKIPVSTAQTCPNREGIKGMKTCNFCDVWGSAAYPEFREKQLKEQILGNRLFVGERTNAENFLVYFQAYTNTFSKTSQLKEQFSVAAQFDFVKGFVVGTRPDCISDAVIELWNEYNKTHFMAVELGVQTFNNDQLEWMRRGHSAEKSIWAIEKIKSQSDVDLGVHLMFGLPGEDEGQMIKTAKLINSLPVDNVKLHNLHVLKNTPLANDYHAGKFKPISRDEYAERVRVFLQYLDPKIAVHRLSALATRSDELVAPDWVGRKMEMYQFMIDHLRDKGAFQGQYFSHE